MRMKFRSISLALTRSRLSIQRTELARGRTYLAVIRTGLAFLTLGLALFRYFGVSAWSLFDGGLAVLSVWMILFGTRGYRRAQRAERKLSDALSRDSLYLGLIRSGAVQDSPGSPQ